MTINDSYDTITKCFGELYQEYCSKLKKIYIRVGVLYQIWADGKQRRIDTGKS